MDELGTPDLEGGYDSHCQCDMDEGRSKESMLGAQNSSIACRDEHKCPDNGVCVQENILKSS